MKERKEAEEAEEAEDEEGKESVSLLLPRNLSISMRQIPRDVEGEEDDDTEQDDVERHGKTMNACPPLPSTPAETHHEGHEAKEEGASHC